VPPTVAPPGVVPVPPAVVTVALFGYTSGEKIAPSAYSERLMP
jgi:xanthosine utilization system XapX-like protein